MSGTTFHPRPPWLDPLDPASVQRWAQIWLRNRRAPGLSLEQRLGLADLLRALAQPPDHYCDDPADEDPLEWEPGWRPAPGWEMARVRAPGLPWRLWWPRWDELTELRFWEDALDDYEAVIHCEDGVSLRGDGGVRLVAGAEEIVLYERRAHYAYDDQCFVPEVGLGGLFQGLTGWAGLDDSPGGPPRVTMEPVVCRSCGIHYETADWRVYTPGCHTCGATDADPDDAWLRPTTTAPGWPAGTAGRMLDDLLAAEWIALDGAREDALAALEAVLEDLLATRIVGLGSPEGAARRLGPALMGCPAVAEVYVSDEALARWLLEW
jgi:hypothetical protein